MKSKAKTPAKPEAKSMQLSGDKKKMSAHLMNKKSKSKGC